MSNPADLLQGTLDLLLLNMLALEPAWLGDRMAGIDLASGKIANINPRPQRRS